MREVVPEKRAESNKGLAAHDARDGGDVRRDDGAAGG